MSLDIIPNSVELFDVTILMSFYNEQDNLSACLSSILVAKKDFNVYFCLVDDCSTDGSYVVASRFVSQLDSGSFCLLRNNVNLGLGSSLQIGLLNCPTSLVLRIDADDICCPDRISLQLDYLREHPDVDILGGAMVFRSSVNGQLKESIVSNPTRHVDIVKSLARNTLFHPTIAFRRDRVLFVGGYSPLLKRKQDLDLWIRSARSGLVFANIPQPVVVYNYSMVRWNKTGFRSSFLHFTIAIKAFIFVRPNIFNLFYSVYPLIRSILPASIRSFLVLNQRRFFSSESPVRF